MQLNDLNDLNELYNALSLSIISSKVLF